MTDTELVTLRDELARIYGEDIAQETILKLLEAQASGTIFDKPDHWARKTAWGLSKQGQRHQARVILQASMDDDRADGTDGPTRPIHPTLIQPATQLSRLEAQEALMIVDPRLVGEAANDTVVLDRNRRKRLRRQAEPHDHTPQRTRPGRCSTCGLGRLHAIHLTDGEEGFGQVA